MDGEALDGGGSLFDPVRDALDSIKSGAKAGLNAIGKGGQKKADKGAGARDDLKSAEKTAEGGGAAKIGEGLTGVRKNESEAGGFYSGVGKSLGGDKGGKGKGKGFLKKAGPMGAIFGLVLAVGGLMGGAQAMMPFSLLSQFQETFDTIKVVNERRSTVFWSKQLKNQDLKNPIHQRYFGFGSNTFKVRSKQKSKLKTQGIYVSDEIDFGNGKGKQSVMLFDDGSGKLKVITAGDTDIDVRRIDLSKVDADIDLSKMEIDTEDVINFKKAFNDVPDFRNGYIKGSRTWRGSVGAWFDNIAYRFLQSNKITRNMFKKWQDKVQAEQNGNTRSAAQKKAVVEVMESDVDEIKMHSEEFDDVEVSEDEETGAKTIKKKVKQNVEGADVQLVDGTSSEDISIKAKAETKAKIKEKLNSVKDGKYGKASGYISAAVNIGCAVFDIIGAINLLIVAQESIQVIQLVTGYFEAIDKVKAGDGEDSPINVLAEGLVTPKSTTVVKDDDSDEINEEVVKGKENTTAMQSEGVSSLYSGKPMNANDKSVQNFNIGARFSSILGYLGNSLTSFAACAMAKAAAAVADTIMDVVAIAGCIASFGIGCLAQAGADALTGAGASGAIAAAAGFAIKIITPLAVKVFTRDLISDLAGEDLGNALVSGANMYMGNNHLNGGGSLATKDKYMAFVIQQKEVIAEEARFERETRSPFDVTSQYTFAGSLVKQMATMYTVKSPIFGTFGKVGSIISSSVTSLLPSASAYDVSSTVDAIDDKEFSVNCPYLASINAVGDAFCNPYIATDVATIDDDPLDVVNTVYDLHGLNDDGSINKTSNLAKYTVYCSQRKSSFGVADGNIAGDFSVGDWDLGNAAASTVANSLTGAIPVVGGLLDLASNTNQLANTGWITGQSCVASDQGVEGGFGVSWDENRYYQRFLEDQRYLEGIDPEYESPVTAFLNEYYAEHPLDNSYEGILAQKSGLTKDEVVAILEIIQEEDMIANYNPSERYAFGRPAVEMQKKLIFDSENQVAENPLIILVNQTVYADLRNRNFAA